MSTSRTYPGINIGWFIPLRLISFTLVFGTIIGWLGLPGYLQFPFLVYSIVTLASLLTLIFYKRHQFRFLLHFLLSLQIIAEIINEAGIVLSTGSMYSPFSALFLLTIVSTALFYRLVGTLLVASVVSIVYAGVTWINASVAANGGVFESLSSTTTTDDTYFYSTFLHILIFYLVAFISGFLADKIQTKDMELDSASKELKKARLDTGDILWHLNCGVITIDGNGEIAYFNRMAQSILGVKESQVSGLNCREAFIGQLAPLGDNLLSVLKSQLRLSRTEFTITRKDGVTLPVGLSTSTLYDENFDARGVIAIFQDLTEAKLLNQKIRQADRLAAVGELSACIAHEIRNPLAAISGSVEVLKSDLILEGDNEKLMSLILKESTRLNKILSDFLLYARVRSPELRKIELNSLISEVIELIQRHPSYNTDIGIELEYDRHITYVSGDEDQLKQLLLNLLVNACEAIDKHTGKITVKISVHTTEAGENRVITSICDNGPGIPVDDLGNIFLPFHSSKKGGTGLGLAIVSQLAELLGGRIEVASQVGQGTEFLLTLRGITDEGSPQIRTLSSTPVSV
ncbi:MAG: PAS domain S-box protein [candidate division Zixibacteria bacterium]|nr:PAS domain S-box protein [candidate division Zixibacteria bacterium]